MSLMGRIFTFLIALNITTYSQKGIESILSSYSGWTTNFNKRNIELSELRSGGPPKDGIPALINPIFTTIAGAKEWLGDNEPVISVSINGLSKAYPLQILIFHEIVNDRIGRTPIAVTFCPLCYSGIVFNRTVNEMPVNFGVSGLLRNSDMIMYDQLTESFWQQFTGEAIVGDQVGNKLTQIPSQIISFKHFSDIYPEGLILARNNAFKRPYGTNPYLNYDKINSIPFLFTGEIDDRLPPNEKVIGIKLDTIAKAYPYSITSNIKIIHDKIGNELIVVFHIPGTVSGLEKRFIEESRDVGSTGVFSPFLHDEKLEFAFIDEKIRDKQTGSVWSITGKCIEGHFKSEQLKKIIHGDYFSFAWFAFNPHSILYKHK